ncbi:MAG: GHKL domain-containing protein, partial [Deltaproteobacteria bacterium]|nr:GHKL domain-containing protein [Deltaproteobacteria bacterium]
LSSRLVLADIERKQMKTQLIVAGKLAEVGEMSSGFAHEINNPLQVMKSEQTLIAEILSEMVEAEEIHASENVRQVKESVEQIGIQIDRCGHITQNLLRFARKTENVLQPIRIQDFLSDAVKMLEQRARIENIRIVLELDPDLPPITSDPNQLQQVFLNLLNNAIYALTDKGSSEIRITSFEEGSDIIISITDNGCGIPPEDMEKIFMPFFTTKPVGHGTGLGLSTVYGIVKGLGGDITVVSELDAGSTFTVRLPREWSGDEKT